MKLRATTNICAFLLAFVAVAALAQDSVEVISLRHRTADQVIPVLRPLLAPGGALTGQYNQLIVRTNPENLAQLRQVLESIDQPSRRLMISVRFDGSRDAARAGALDSRSASDGRVDQRLQVLEGGQAFISAGEARYYAEAATGFSVVPRLSGDQVTLDIAAQQDAFTRAGAIRGQQAASTVGGRLGEWIELGGAGSATARAGSGMLSSRESSATESRRIWLKVEEIR